MWRKHQGPQIEEIAGQGRCPKCGSTNLTTSYQKFKPPDREMLVRCGSCGWREDRPSLEALEEE